MSANSRHVRWAFDSRLSEEQCYKAKVIEKGDIGVLGTF